MQASSMISRGVILMMASVMLIPISDVIAKWMSGAYPVLQIAWMRFAFVTLLLSPVMLYLVVRQGVSLRTDKPVIELLRASSMVSNIFLYIKALQTLPLPDALGIFFLYPAITLLLSHNFLGESVSTEQYWMLLLGFCGVLLIVKPELAYSRGALYALASSFCISVNMTLSRYLSPYSNPIVGLFYTSLLGLVVMSFFVVGVWKSPEASDWSAFVLMAVVAAMCNGLLYASFRYAQASILGPLGYFEIVSATAMSYWIFDHLPDVYTTLGLLMIIGSGLALTLWKRQPTVAPE